LPKPIGVIDTSCVIALESANLLPSLTVLFHRLLLPKAVRAELYRRRGTKDRLRALQRDYAFIVPCDDYDQAAVDTVLADPKRRRKDRGEAETVVQASTLGAIAVVDDRWGRSLAERFSLECHGTLWVLERLHRLGLLPAQGVRQCLVTFKDRGIRFPPREANKLLLRIHEPPLGSSSPS
jgi:predicted nucleic acid-binding protein